MDKIIAYLYLIIIIVVPFAVPLWKLRELWRELKTRGHKFNYTITDIWAAILALTPSILLTTRLITTFEVSMAFVLLLFGTGQCIGIIAGKIKSTLDHPRSSNLTSAIHILKYSIGCGGLVVGLFVFSIPAAGIAIALFLGLAPIYLIVVSAQRIGIFVAKVILEMGQPRPAIWAYVCYILLWAIGLSIIGLMITSTLPFSVKAVLAAPVVALFVIFAVREKSFGK